ncbi:MAG: ParA family protein [Eubacteriales bacterium]
MEIFSVVNQKGGVAKTFTSVNVAIGLAKQGFKVLAIDLDPQGSMSISLGLENPDDEPITVATVFEHLKNREEFDPREGIRQHPEGIDYLPANIELVDTEMNMVSAMSREHLLGKYLQLLQDDYEVVVIDCSPSLGVVTTNALACSHQVIIPIQAQYLSVKGMEQLFRTVGQVQQVLNPHLIVGGILVTMANPRTKEYKETSASLHEKYSDKARIFETIIPSSTKAAETSKHGKSIFAHDPKGKVALAYESLIGELIRYDDEEEEYEEEEILEVTEENEELPDEVEEIQEEVQEEVIQEAEENYQEDEREVG